MIEYAVRVETGRKQQNDDRGMIDGVIVDQGLFRGQTELPLAAVVCDGCGGYNGGYMAAETVLDCIGVSEPGMLLEPEHLRTMLSICEEKVQEAKKTYPAFSQMCTTIAGMVVGETGMNIFHSGDSRVYRCTARGLARMTMDHSVVEYMVRQGELTEAQARESDMRNRITQCIGIGGPEPEIYVSRVSIRRKEKYLLCSDGLWEYVEDAVMESILKAEIPLGEMAERLVKLALANGSNDNITACILYRPE